jgi:hypothetical protein
MIRKLLKILGVILVLLIVGFGCLYFVYNEKLPEGQSGPEADALAQKMLNSLNYETYQQTRFLEWSFQGGAHKYKWDKQKAMVEVKWDNYLVQLDLISKKSSLVFKDKERLNENESASIIADALDYFNNDSLQSIRRRNTAQYCTLRRWFKWSVGYLRFGWFYTGGFLFMDFTTQRIP